MSTILGIDPGSRITGYGIISVTQANTKYIASGNISVKHSNFPDNLRQIFNGIKKIVEQYNPNEIAIEKVFVHANVNSALKLGQARGAALVAIANSDILLAEYTARQIKQAVVGYGAAAKVQIQHMVKFLLHLDENPEENEADALAVALCHAHMRKVLAKIEQSKSKGKLQ